MQNARLVNRTPNHEAYPMKPSSDKRFLFPWRMISVAILIILSIILVIYYLYRTEARQLEQRVVMELETIAQLKVSQIVQWRKQLLSDAGEIMTSPFFNQHITEWLDRQEPEKTKTLLERFAGIRENLNYQNVIWVDTNGLIRLSLSPTAKRLTDDDFGKLRIALNNQKPCLNDLHLCPEKNLPIIDLIAPTFSRRVGTKEAIGALILQIDPQQYLYPLLQSWPMPSRTAETLLVRREDGHVLLLNDVRFLPKATLTHKIALTKTEDPTVQAVNGRQSVFIGTDYRGESVLSILRPIPDSPWFLVTKMDTQEAFAPISHNRGLFLILTLGLIAAVLSGAGLLWQYNRKLHYKTVYQAELERRVLLSHFEHLMKYANDIIFLVDENNRIVDANERALESYQYTREEIIGLDLTELIAPEDREGLETRMQEVAEKQGIVREAVHRRKNGTHFPVEVSERAIRVNGHHFIQGIVRDISERKQAEEELQKLAMVVHYSSELVNLATLDGQMVFLNEAGGRLLGISPDEAKKHHILDVVPENYMDIAQNEIIPTLIAGGKWEGELQYRNIRTDARIDVHAMTFTIKDPDTRAPVYLANVSMDITERKRAEAERIRLEEQLLQAQRLESIGRLAGGVAHDFNNMLSIIMGYAEILVRGLPEDDPIKVKTLEIISAAERSRDLTRQLLAFARKQTLDMKPLDLNHIVEGFEKMLKRTLQENVETTIRLSPSPCFFEGDVGQIEQIILNLAVNAQDAMPDGGTLIMETSTVYLDDTYTRTHTEVHPGHYVMLSVSDTGMGMSPETLEKIFEPFYTTKDVGKGTGLGLSTVYGIVKQHGGSISVYSESGKGTSFRIYFPKTRGAAPDKAVGTKAIDESTGGSETVLVVEDNKEVRHLACEILDIYGYTVLNIPDGKSAIEVAKSHPTPIDLLVTDVIMPDINGRELFEQIAQIRKGIKALFMSGYPADVISHHGVLEAGVHFIQKPFSLHDFAEKVRKVLDSDPPSASPAA